MRYNKRDALFASLLLYACVRNVLHTTSSQEISPWFVAHKPVTWIPGHSRGTNRCLTGSNDGLVPSYLYFSHVYTLNDQ